MRIKIIFCFNLYFFFFFHHAYSYEKQIIFSSDFETAKTLISKPVAPKHKRIYLIPTQELDCWPVDGGKGWISSPQQAEPSPFTYKERKENMLLDIESIGHHYPVYSEIFTTSFKNWHDVHRKNISTFSPGIHDVSSARINFTSPGHVMLTTPHIPDNEFYGRFYVLISKEALNSLNKSLAWFFKGLFFRIGIKKERVYQTPHICLRFHTKMRIKQKKDIYLIMKEPCLADKEYCIEFHMVEGDSLNGGGALWIDGQLIGSSFGLDTYRVNPGNEFVFGKFSESCFPKGYMLVDDVVISANRIGPIPEPAGTFLAESGDSAKSSKPGFIIRRVKKACFTQIQAVQTGKSWFMCDYNSGRINLNEELFTLPVQLNPNADYCIRMRVQNAFQNWSGWSNPMRFRTQDQKTTDTLYLPAPVDAWFSRTDKTRRLRRIITGKWYDLHIDLGSGQNAKNVKNTRIILHHFSNTNSSPWNMGSFHERGNYMFDLDPRNRTIWFIRKKNLQSLELSGQKHEYIDDSQGQYHVDLDKGRMHACFRLSPKAALGPWVLNAFCYDGKGNLSPVLKTPIIVARETEPDTVFYFLIYFIAASFILLTLILGYRLKRRRVLATKGQGVDTTLPKTRVKQAKEYIDQNYSKPDVTLEKVSKEINISANYLSKQFKHEVGQSFPEYLNNIRLGKARELLKTSNLTISEIAYTIGYNTQEYFNKVFKSSLKCTPGEYRQKYLEK